VRGQNLLRCISGTSPERWKWVIDFVVVAGLCGELHFASL
jgi:hypothetical protein